MCMRLLLLMIYCGREKCFTCTDVALKLLKFYSINAINVQGFFDMLTIILNDIFKLQLPMLLQINYLVSLVHMILYIVYNWKHDTYLGAKSLGTYVSFIVFIIDS